MYKFIRIMYVCNFSMKRWGYKDWGFNIIFKYIESLKVEIMF